MPKEGAEAFMGVVEVMEGVTAGVGKAEVGKAGVGKAVPLLSLVQPTIMYAMIRGM
jgi:hypothetical protein